MGLTSITSVYTYICMNDLIAIIDNAKAESFRNSEPLHNEALTKRWTDTHTLPPSNIPWHYTSLTDNFQFFQPVGIPGLHV